MLSRAPIEHDWCAARPETNPDEGTYYFCGWLGTPSCPYLQCADPREDCDRCATGDGACMRDGNGSVPVESGVPGPRAKPRPTAKASRRVPPRRVVGETTAPPSERGRRAGIPVAARGCVRPPSRLSTPRGDARLRRLSGGVRLVPSGEEPAIAGKGLQQTYLLFGGPGAGKTYFFRHLMTALLGHGNPKPGCLLLDPKGVLTDWLSRVLELHGRSDDLTVIAAGKNEYAFNVLGTTRPIGVAARDAGSSAAGGRSTPVRGRPRGRDGGRGLGAPTERSAGVLGHRPVGAHAGRPTQRRHMAPPDPLHPALHLQGGEARAVSDRDRPASVVRPPGSGRPDGEQANREVLSRPWSPISSATCGRRSSGPSAS